VGTQSNAMAASPVPGTVNLLPKDCVVGRRPDGGADLNKVIEMLHGLERMQNVLDEKYDHQTKLLKLLLTPTTTTRTTTPQGPSEDIPDGICVMAVEDTGNDENGEEPDWLEHYENGCSPQYEEHGRLQTPTIGEELAHNDAFVLDLFNAEQSKSMMSKFHSSYGTGHIRYFVSSMWWMLLSAAMILINSVFIGIEVQGETHFWIHKSIQKGADPVEWDSTNFWPRVHIVFLCWMIFELCLNIYAQRKDFLLGTDRGWNLFDVLIVGLDFVMQIVDSTSVVFLRVLRLLRIARILRAFRVVKFLRGIRNMLISMSGSFISLMSAILIMGIFVYVVSLIMMQGVAYELGVAAGVEGGRRLESGHDLDSAFFWTGGLAETEQLALFYGSIQRTMLTLFMSVTGGIDWRVAAYPLARLGMWYSVLWVGYIAFMVLGVLNILTGIFVDAAMQSMNGDRDNVVATRIEENQSLIKGINALFKATDKDGSGFLSEEEFEMLLEDVEMVAYLDAMGIDISEVKYLWRLLDADHSGQISINECVAGFLRMKGPARAIDIVELLHENQTLMKQITAVHRDLRLVVKNRQKITSYAGSEVRVRTPTSTKESAFI